MSDTGIRKHGTVFALDEDGYIINHLSEEGIQPEWRRVVDDAVEFGKRECGDALQSVFVRGSVAAGNAIPGISDVDAIFIFKRTPKNVGNVMREIRRSMKEHHGHLVSKVDIDHAEAGDIRRVLAIMLATQSVCVYGEDISKDLPKVHITEAHQHREDIREEIEDTYQEMDSLDNEKDITMTEQWIFSRLIRALYEHVMTETGIYTRSLYYNYTYFAELHPAYESDVYAFLQHAVEPRGDKEAIKKDLERGLDILERVKD